MARQTPATYFQQLWWVFSPGDECPKCHHRLNDSCVCETCGFPSCGWNGKKGRDGDVGDVERTVEGMAKKNTARNGERMTVPYGKRSVRKCAQSAPAGWEFNDYNGVWEKLYDGDLYGEVIEDYGYTLYQADGVDGEVLSSGGSPDPYKAMKTCDEEAAVWLGNGGSWIGGKRVSRRKVAYKRKADRGDELQAILNEYIEDCYPNDMAIEAVSDFLDWLYMTGKKATRKRASGGILEWIEGVTLDDFDIEPTQGEGSYVLERDGYTLKLNNYTFGEWTPEIYGIDGMPPWVKSDLAFDDPYDALDELVDMVFVEASKGRLAARNRRRR